jgi:hypothetical protein
MSNQLTRRKAVDAMYRGAVLIKTHGDDYFVVPGDRVTPLVAEQIMAMPNVRGQLDALWPGMSQTWRVQ